MVCNCTEKHCTGVFSPVVLWYAFRNTLIPSECSSACTQEDVCPPSQMLMELYKSDCVQIS